MIKMQNGGWEPSEKRKVSEAKIEANKKGWGNLPRKELTPLVPVETRKREWNDISGILMPQTIRSFLGISTFDKFSIDDNYMVRNKNITTSQFPAAQTRKGFSRLGGNAQYLGTTTSMGVHKGKELHAIVGTTDASWRRWNETTGEWDTLLSGLAADVKWSFTNFKGNFADISLIGANGIDPVKVYNGTTVTNLANAPIGMNYVVGHSNRLYGAVGSALHYSALRKATDWNTVDESGQIEIETNDGEKITSVVSGPGKINVFMKHSMHELYGTSPRNYQLQIISDEIGCVAHQTVVTIGGTMYFLSHDGLYRYTGGSMPTKEFSLPVQSIFSRLNPLAMHKAVAGTDGERYYISFPVDSETANNIDLEYDPKFDTWNMWDYGSTIATGATGYELIDGTMYIASNSNAVMKMGGTVDVNITTDPIPYLLETKPFSQSSLASDNRLYRLWVTADVPIGSTLNISISNEDEGDDSWVLLRTVSAEEDIQASSIVVPVNQSFHHKFVRIKLEGTGPVIIHEITRQERTFRMGIGGQ